MKMLTAFRVIVCLWALVLFGCAGLKEANRLVQLDDVTFAYEQTLTQGSYRAANKLTTPQSNRDLPDFDFLKNIQISNYQPIDKNSSPDGMTAVVTVEIQYFHAHYLIEKTIEDVQEWEYDPEMQQWFLMSGLPDFK